MPSSLKIDNVRDFANQNDVAVLTIDPPINFSKDVSPVCLPPASSAVDQFVGKDAAIMGDMGMINTSSPTSPTLQQAIVQVTTNAKCSEGWSASPSPVSNQHICASAPKKDTCKSDNGGPMVAQTKDDSTSWTQVGITSFGNECAGGKPMVFASVAFFRKWIDTYIAAAPLHLHEILRELLAPCDDVTVNFSGYTTI
ncbi:hypothetical protein DAPPUDRAFT_244722 [Daphnia pulex]|uniref:Peptidase S1 domain-containing protein n=1 Tax=Daphnia pulex TaxID=6669 RepID=E9GLM9_DAPPU|nr:hypothetical protein DAPPUDRAFT_244722 [Daphnia pulex]|eukprot:EFX79660.1 hypothetical protein DAPPUDRAFT_244722 [Daphnia pulex]